MELEIEPGRLVQDGGSPRTIQKVVPFPPIIGGYLLGRRRGLCREKEVVGLDDRVRWYAGGLAILKVRGSVMAMVMT